MKQLFRYAFLGISFFTILLYGCAGAKERKPITVLRQFTGLDSGIMLTEYHIFFTQDEINSFLGKKAQEGSPIPTAGFSGISDDEMCLLVFIGERSAIHSLLHELIEEQDKIIFKVDAEGYQTVDPHHYIEWMEETPDNSRKVTPIEKDGISDLYTKRSTPFGYFIIPKTNKKIIIEKGDLNPK